MGGGGQSVSQGTHCTTQCYAHTHIRTFGSSSATPRRMVSAVNLPFSASGAMTTTPADTSCVAAAANDDMTGFLELGSLVKPSNTLLSTDFLTFSFTHFRTKPWTHNAARALGHLTQ